MLSVQVIATCRQEKILDWKQVNLPQSGFISPKTLISVLAGSTQQHWPFPKEQEECGYAYILTHPGMPCVLWEHYFDYGLKDAISKLIDIR